MPEMLLSLLLLFLHVLPNTQTAAASPPMALPNCPSECGNLTVPYPFGILDGCSMNSSFLLTCNDTFNPPRLFFETDAFLHIEVTNISLDSLTIFYTHIAEECFTDRLDPTKTSLTLFDLGENLPYTLSTTRNKFTVIGCDTLGMFFGADGGYTGCFSFCSNTSVITNGTCSGEGCCQAALKKGTKKVTTSVRSVFNHTLNRNVSNCSAAFVVEQESYRFATADVTNFEPTEVPVVLEWAVGEGTCAKANRSSGFACVGGVGKTSCVDSETEAGYQCQCLEGYEGNPYLPEGCQDRDECREGTHQCSHICINNRGNYSCSCPKGFDGDGYTTGKGCVKKNKLSTSVIVLVCFASATLVLVPTVTWLWWLKRKREYMQLQKDYFLRNGGLLLQSQLSSAPGDEQAARLFTEDELKDATGGFSQKMVLGKGANGEVYKGILPNQKFVAIKRSTQMMNEGSVDQFVNEITVLSKVVHRNVVRLVGCCLETKIPLLVYEFIPHGTLYEHIHEAGRAAALSWKTRLRIAAETAGAIAHLHFGLNRQIIHRDIKSANILVDEGFTAKVADFGASRLAPLDENDEATMVLGTRGYLDPEYHDTGFISDRSDVYSFGVVLAELITGKKAIWFTTTRAVALSAYLLDALKLGTLPEILDPCVRGEEDMRHAVAVAEIARRCLERNPEKRPSMKEVAAELEKLRGYGDGEQVKEKVGAAVHEEKVMKASRRSSMDAAESSAAFPILWSMDLQR